MEIASILLIIYIFLFGLKSIFLLGYSEFEKSSLYCGYSYFHIDTEDVISLDKRQEESSTRKGEATSPKPNRRTKNSLFKTPIAVNVSQIEGITENKMLKLLMANDSIFSDKFKEQKMKTTLRRKKSLGSVSFLTSTELIRLMVILFFFSRKPCVFGTDYIKTLLTGESVLKEKCQLLEGQGMSGAYCQVKKMCFGLLNRRLSMFKTAITYSLSALETLRLATFRNLPLAYMPQNLSVLLLANGGFSYRGQGDLVQCDVCKKQVALNSFVSDDDSMLDPKDLVFHKMQCTILTDGIDSQPSLDAKGNNTVSNLDPAPESEMSLANEHSVPTVTQLNDIDADCYSCLEKKDEQINSSYLPSDTPQHCHKEKANMNSEDCSKSLPGQDTRNSGLLVGAEASPQSYQSQAAIDDGYISDDPNFIDSAHFIPELTNVCAEDFRQPMRALKCDKNPGHFAYFPMAFLKLEQLPSKMRLPEFLNFLQLFGMLTVRIVVKETSTARHKSDPAFQKTDNPRSGTGYVSFEDFDLAANVDKSSMASGHGKWKTVKNYMKTFVKKNSEKLYIETNYHLVFDNFEAANTTVEFFFDDLTRKNVKAVKCVGMRHSGIAGDSRVILECKSADQEFISRIHQIKHQLKEVVEKLPRKIKAMMCKKLFIIHHPHGREKHLSYGDSVTVKYIVDQNRHGRNRMARTNNQTKELNVRKLMQYAADTCPGTSGAPVLSFLRGLPDANGSITYHLDIWIHNGEDRKNKLGGASMKELTPEDHLQTHLQSGAEEDSGEEDESSENQTVCAPSLKVLPPAYQDFVLYIQRLESYTKLNHKLIHSLRYLAQAGFFYGGERIFQQKVPSCSEDYEGDDR